MFHRINSISIALLALAATACDSGESALELGDAQSLRCGEEKAKMVEATPELVDLFADFNFDLKLGYYGSEVELTTDLDQPCVDGQTQEVTSKSGHTFEENGETFKVVYTVVTDWVCEDGEWIEGISYCPVDQPCFSVSPV